MEPQWNWVDCEYRVAPERWAGKIWLHPDGAITRDSPSIDGPLFERHGWRLIEAKQVEP